MPGQLGWLARESPGSTLPHPAFILGRAWGWNSGPCVCKASTVPAEPSPQLPPPSDLKQSWPEKEILLPYVVMLPSAQSQAAAHVDFEQSIGFVSTL